MPHLLNAALRPLRACETPLAIEWAINEGWNPGLFDGLVFHAADPGSFLTVEIKGSPAGVISAVRMTPDFGFIGFFVLPPCSRRSIAAWSLLHASLDRMEGRVIGADGVLDRVHTYANYGLVPAYRTLSFQGATPDRPAVWHPSIALANETPFCELAAYDAANFGVHRDEFLREWLRLPESRSVVFKRKNRVCGFGTIRRCQRGVRIGPLQGDDPEAVEAVFDALAGFAPGEDIAVDCPEPNADAAKLMRKKALAPVSITARLYRGTPPPARLQRIYGLMSFALG